jgi:hypothetical protein
MQTAALSLDTLHLLSDELKLDFEEQMRVAVADCRKRPAFGKARTVKVELRIKPHPDDADDVLIEPVTTLKTPARQLDPIRARRSKQDQLQFDFDET